MISKEDRIWLKNISLDNYGKNIADKLNSKGIKPIKSEIYTPTTVSRVLRGEQEDINAEWAIFHHYREIHLKKIEVKEIRSKYLKQPESTDLANTK
jgi:hypothetical protein